LKGGTYIGNEGVRDEKRQEYSSLECEEDRKLEPWKGRLLKTLSSSFGVYERDFLISDASISRHGPRGEGKVGKVPDRSDNTCPVL
jgi:hypothetical protein